MTDDYDNVDFLAENDHEALRMIAIGLGIVVYLGVLLFTAVHNINLMTVGIAEEWRWAAYLGVVALELSAIAFPLGLHYWTFALMHRGALILFYITDFLLLMGNTIIDYAMVAGNELPVWGEAYVMYFAPSAPLFALAAWAILLALDPRQQQAMRMAQIRTGIRMQMANQIANSMLSAEVRAAITDEAVQRARVITANTLSEGKQNVGRLPAKVPTPDIVSDNGGNPTRGSRR